MNIRRFLFLLCGSLFYLALPAQTFQTYPDDPLGVKKTVLPNGFTVYLIEEHSQPVVMGAVAVKAGGKYDPKDATGMGHYLEHMLFKGTQDLGTIDYLKEKTYLDRIDSLYEVLGKTTDEVKRKEVQTAINDNAVQAAQYAIPNEFDRLIASIGGTGLNAFTTEEMIVYHNSFPPNQIEKWLDIYAHRFQNPVFRLFQSELETVYEEKNRAMDNFGYNLILAFNKQLYKNHPYGQQDVLGLTEHLKNPSLIKMYDYYRTYYVANNMALVLSGDFDADKVVPMIQAKFGKLPKGDIPQYPEYPEADFKGREYIKGRYTPVKAGLAAFRTVPIGHPDEAALDVVNHLLSNEGQTGYLDQLTLDQQLLTAQMVPMSYLDHGSTLMIIVPKLIGQSVKNAEEKVLAQLRRIRLGDFEDWQLEAAKTALRIDFLNELEEPRTRALAVVNTFIEDREWSEHLGYRQEIAAVDRDKVIATAQKYYGDNYLLLESKMGFPKKQTLEKPGYKAPLPPADAQSTYGRYFESLPEQAPVPRFVDFNKDLHTQSLGSHVTLYHVNNPFNDIFNLKLRFSIGSRKDPRLAHAAGYMDVLGTDSLDVTALKKAFSVLGTTYSIQAEANYTVLELSGLEENLLPSLQLLHHLISRVQNDQSKVAILIREEKTNRKFEEKDVDAIAQAASSYVLYGALSESVNRLSLKELDQLQGDTLLQLFRQTLDYACEVHYTGKVAPKEVQVALARTVFSQRQPSKPALWVTRNQRVPDQKQVYFLPRKDAIQSHLTFLKDAGPYKKEDLWLVDAFNEYFGAGMSGLVFQEIREFRSLAYTANAPVRTPETANGTFYLSGYIGCQADKTAEALQVMTGLIEAMPQKAERMEVIRKAVTQSAYTERPGFRYLSLMVLACKRLGLEEDPAAYKLRFYEGLTFDRMYAWYQSHISPKTSPTPVITVVTGDPRKVSMETLTQYGPVTELSMDQIFTN